MKDKKSFNLFEYDNLFDEEIQISYKGPFDQHVLSVLGNYIKVIIGEKLEVGKKIFKIFIELAQNISYYSADVNKYHAATQSSGMGIIVIRELDDSFAFHTGNPVKHEDVIPIIEKCEIINTLDREGLRKYKRVQRNLPPGNLGGAHIGLIQVALTSANPLDIKVTPIDDKLSFFSIAVKINKDKS